MRIEATVVFFILFSSPCLAQTKGSVGEYRVQGEMQRRSVQEEIGWREAKKLSIKGESPKEQPIAKSMDFDTAPEGSVGFLHKWAFKVQTIIDSKNMIVRLGTNGSFWIEGYPTEGLVDDESVRLIGPWLVLPPHKYLSRSLKSFRPVTTEEIDKAEAKAKKEEADRLAATCEKLTKLDGSVVEVRFVKYSKGTYTLADKEGVEIQVKADEFKPESSKKLASWFKNQGKKL